MNLKYLKHLAKRNASYIHPKGYQATRLLIDHLNIHKKDNILEIGCGTGATLCEITYMNDVLIEGMDILDEMLKAASERIAFLGLQSKAKVKLYSEGKPFPYEDGIFDKAYAESVMGFQEISQIEYLFKEIYRVLKAGGLFAINEALWSENADINVIAKINKKANEAFGLGPASPQKITEKSFIKMAENSGFKLKKVIELKNLAANETKNINTRFLKLQKKFSRKNVIKKMMSFRYLIDEIIFRKNFFSQNKYTDLLYSYLFIFKKEDFL